MLAVHTVTNAKSMKFGHDKYETFSLLCNQVLACHSTRVARSQGCHISSLRTFGPGELKRTRIIIDCTDNLIFILSGGARRTR